MTVREAMPGLVGLAGLAVLVVGCSGAAPPRAAPRPAAAAATPGAESEAAAAGDAEADFARALDTALRGEESLEGLRLQMGCLRDEGFRQLEAWGNGVAVWNEESQFRLSYGELLELLRLFERYRFADMRASYGGKDDPDPNAPRPPEQGSAIRVVCHVELKLGAASKRSVQIFGGRQHQDLWDLAAAIFELCTEPAKSGVRAASLSEGLRKIARGELAPEAFDLVAHRKSETPASAPEASWLLILDGAAATARSYTASRGLGEEVRLDLGPEEVAELMRVLAKARFEEMPDNLWAQDYTDFSVKVLNHEKSLQARRFAGLSPTAHGDQQDLFNRAFDVVAELSRRVRAEGIPVPAP